MLSKVGYEGTWTLFLMGIEIKYLSDFKYSTATITPKIGISPYCVISLYYGYNFMPKSTPFPFIYGNQFSVTINMSRKLWKEISSSETEVRK